MMDIVNVFFKPAETIAEAMEKKRWQIPLFLIVAVMMVFTYITSPISQQDQRDIFVNSPKYEQLPEKVQQEYENTTVSTGERVFKSLAGGVISLLFLGLATLMIMMFYKAAGAVGSTINYFSGLVTASLIDIGLGQLIHLAMAGAKQTMFVSVSPAALFPTLERTGFTYLLLSNCGVFSCWFMIALALGIARYAKISTTKSLLAGGGYFTLRTLLLTFMSYLPFKLLGY